MLWVHRRTGVLLESRQGRSLHVSIDLVLSGQSRSHGMQPHECQLLWLAEVNSVELAVTLVISAPVPASALIAGLLFARRKRPADAGEGEGGGCLQPAVPSWRSDEQCACLSIVLIGESLTLYERSCSCRVSHPRTLSPEHRRFPNSIAHVRNRGHALFPFKARKALLLLQQRRAPGKRVCIP